ncbi:unnamed protein product, partial [Arabidopsis halleri]
LSRSLRRISSLLKSGPFTSSPQVGTISSQLNLFKLRVSKLVMKDDVRELFHTWPDEEEDP